MTERKRGSAAAGPKAGTKPKATTTGTAGHTIAPPRPNAITPLEALIRLRDGNLRYAANAPEQKDFSSGRAARATAQYPIAAILSCADSRVSPELVFDQGPGELFVVRVAGNCLNTDILASLEYGVEFLGIPLIAVLGHTGCGAVGAAIKVMKQDAKLPGHLPDLVRSIKPAVVLAEKHRGGDLLEDAIVENVRRNVAALKRASPVLAQAYEAKRIEVVGGVYDLATGRAALV